MQTVATATTKWPSGDHVADFTVRDGALVVALDFKGLSDECLTLVRERVDAELAMRMTGEQRDHREGQVGTISFESAGYGVPSTTWPSGDHVPDISIRDGALVVAIDFDGLANEALTALRDRIDDEIGDRNEPNADDGQVVVTSGGGRPDE